MNDGHIFIRTGSAGNIEPDKEKNDVDIAMIMELDGAIRCGTT